MLARIVLIQFLVFTPWVLSAVDVVTLQRAIDALPPGAVFHIPPENYQGSLVVRRSLTLMAKAGTTLTHQTGSPGPTLWIQAPGVHLEGLTVVGSGEGSRREQTAVVVTGDRAVLTDLTIRDAWAGLWIDGANRVTVQGLRFIGLADLPFWERGDGVRVSTAAQTTLENLDLVHTADGVYAEIATDTRLTGVKVTDARYGVHVMFGIRGWGQNLSTSQTVVGFMAMETSDWTIMASSFQAGYRTGSAGVRQTRTKNLVVQGSLIAGHATGFELLDARQGRLSKNLVQENTVAYTLAGDNTGTEVFGNVHQGNLVDLSANVDKQSEEKVRPLFDKNYWDAWRGFDLNGDGWGDTPYRFDPVAAARVAQKPWTGVFQGSPWTTFTQTLPGGEPLDPRPLVRPPVTESP